MNLLELTLQGGVLIGAILLLRLLGRYRLPGWTFRILWGVALARLLIPVALPFPWNVYAGLERLLSPEAAQPIPSESGALVQAFPVPPVSDLPGRDMPSAPQEPAWSGAAQTAPMEIPWPAILWLAGAVLLAVAFVVSYRRSVAVFRTSLPLTHPAINRWRQCYPVLRGVPIHRCDRIRSPLTYGLVRPVILLPKGMDCDQEEVGYILLHEGTHIKHRDAWWKLFLAAALCVHWFNPLVWCMYVWANRDLERCCDESVVRRCGLEARSEYALTLLKWEERRSGLLPLCSNFGTPILKERVVFIMKLKKQSAAAVALTLALVMGTTVAFATGPAPETAENTPVSQGAQTQMPDAASPESSAKPNTIMAAAGVKPELDSPKPEIDSTIQPQTAEPAAEPEDVSLQVPGEPQVSEPQVPTQTEEPLVDRWNLPEGDLPEGLEIPVATLEEKEALSNYLHQVRGIRQGDLGYVTYDDGQMAVRVTYVASKQEAQFWEEHPTGEYPVNSKGETYGALGDRRYTGEVPDLIGVGTDDGGIGYVTYEEYVRGIHLGYPGNYNSAEEMATTYEEWCKLMPLYYSIPVYDVEHEQVVGQFSVYNPDSYDRTQESIEEELETVAGTLKNTLGWSEEEIQNYIQQRRDQYAR